MNTLLWILAGILLYSVVAVALQNRGVFPESVKVQGPLTTLHTKRGRAFLNWLAGPERFWRAWSNLGLGVALVIMAGTFLMLIRNAISIVQNPPAPTPVNNPQNVLVIPGVNRFLPLAVAPEIVLGLLVGLVVHEGGHGLLCRVEDIDIESMGLVFFTILPVGAFVEPDEESQKRADRGSRSRMFAAGVTNNFAVTAIAFALLVGPVVGSIAVAPGAPVGGVFEGSPADRAGIEKGDRIVAVAGDPIEQGESLEEALTAADDATITVTVASGAMKTVTRSLLVTAMAPDSPLAADGEAGVDVNDTIVAVGDTKVQTEEGFRKALQSRYVATIHTADGRSVTGPVGVLAQAVPENPLAEAGLPTDERFVVVAIDGTRTLTLADVTAALEGTGAGESVTVVAYVDGERRELTVELVTDPRKGETGGFLGIAPSASYSGIQISSFGVRTYPAAQFLDLLSGGEGSLLSRVLIVLILPFIGAIYPGFSYNFAGFVGWNTNFYEVTGVLEPLGGLVFLLANALFWTGWVNLNLAFFNCIPAFPLDGGRILRAATESVVARLPVENKPGVTRVVTTSVGLTMGLALFLVVFGPQLLG